MFEYYLIIRDLGGFLCLILKVEGFGYVIVEGMSCCCLIFIIDFDGIKSFIFYNYIGKIYF